MPARNGLLEMA